MLSYRGETKASADGGDWKPWPGAIQGAYAWTLAWCGDRTLAIFQHGAFEGEGEKRGWNEDAKRSLRVSARPGEWVELPAPGGEPEWLAAACDGSAAWLVTK